MSVYVNKLVDVFVEFDLLEKKTIIYFQKTIDLYNSLPFIHSYT
jgi:hypothetical protein